MKALEEKIIEILDNNLDYKPHCITGMGTSAKEIASMMKEFVEWLEFDTKFECIKKTLTGEIFWQIPHEDRMDGTHYSFDELFDYWLKNIKK